jgi:hypothetical protein
LLHNTIKTADKVGLKEKKKKTNTYVECRKTEKQKKPKFQFSTFSSSAGSVRVKVNLDFLTEKSLKKVKTLILKAFNFVAQVFKK